MVENISKEEILILQLPSTADSLPPVELLDQPRLDEHLRADACQRPALL